MLVTFLSDHTYIPERAGGRESSIHDLSLALMSAGFKVSVVAAKNKKLSSFWTRATNRLPYTVKRVPNPIEYVCNFTKENGILIANLDNRNLPFLVNRYKHRPSAIFFRDSQSLESIPSGLTKDFILISNSKYMSDAVSEVLGLNTFIFPPFIDPTQYQVTARGPYITFINPVPKKGLDIAKAVAREMPEFPFLFVEGWPLSKQAWDELKRFATETPNVKLKSRTRDMRRIYKATRVLLAPSIWEEAWGRVVTEAHFSYIPVVVSDSGALSRVTKNGGLVVSRDSPTAEWVEALRSAYQDGPVRDELSRGAHLAADDYIRKSKMAIADFIAILNAVRK